MDYRKCRKRKQVEETAVNHWHDLIVGSTDLRQATNSENVFGDERQTLLFEEPVPKRDAAGIVVTDGDSVLDISARPP